MVKQNKIQLFEKSKHEHILWDYTKYDLNTLHKTRLSLKSHLRAHV